MTVTGVWLPDKRATKVMCPVPWLLLPLASGSISKPPKPTSTSPGAVHTCSNTSGCTYCCCGGCCCCTCLRGKGGLGCWCSMFGSSTTRSWALMPCWQPKGTRSEPQGIQELASAFHMKWCMQSRTWTNKKKQRECGAHMKCSDLLGSPGSQVVR